ncbi:phosphoglycerate mutase-like protein [Coleophoma cylindrospora]|uniref:Phosphoglycerate mutase-like protein n=1 Tax=Coleophoma cylindrospora TaxID=1849047 RepID=A0A3D8S7X8_9HELO|nr:phosphoglycerate mutase-like protein [Coleophoma cylindrospora]
MRLLLIRHGETVDNVAGKYAGITDSALTNHGVLQANRLGSYLAASGLVISHIFSSDLQRAAKTADAIRAAQSQSESSLKEVTKLTLLREQDFGFYEGKMFLERSGDSNKSGKDAHIEKHRNDPGFKDVESKESMKNRMDDFINAHLLHLFQSVEDGETVAVVAHGIILSHLWRCILSRFPSSNVSVDAGVLAPDKMLSLEYLGGWSNTGYLELEVKQMTKDVPKGSDVDTSKPTKTETGAIIAPAATVSSDKSSSASALESIPVVPKAPLPKLSCLSLAVKAVNSLAHLKGLKKTRGGIGNLKHDSSQKTMDSFFKKRKRESP